MALFTTDYSKNEENNYKPVPEGDYEVIIEKAEPDATPNGTEFLAVNYRIREDLDKALPETNGKYHKRLIFGQYWKRKQTGKYSQTDVNRMLAAVGVPEGTPIKDWNDFSDKLVGQPVLIHVTVDENEYQGKKTERNQVASWNIAPTKYPLQKDPFSNNGGAELTEDDIPF